MGFCSCVNKLFLVVLNFIIFAVGVGVVALASIVIHRSSEYGELFLDGILTLPIWTLIVGIVITLLGFFGCCGAMRENSCMLYTYAVIVTILFLCEVVLGILVAIYPQKAAEHIMEGMDEAFKKYGGEDQSLKRAIDNIQHDLRCCGVEGPNDWQKDYAQPIPRSCCKDDSTCNPNTAGDIFEQGCYNAIVDSLKGVTVALGVTAIVLGIVQVICICIACGLAKKKSQYV